MGKMAVIFPGIGYTCAKPLLYYSAKRAAEAGYEVRRAEYGGFPSGVKGNKEKMDFAFETALAQAEEILSEVNWEEQEDILFLSKSVGTRVSGAYAQNHQLKVRNILYTPIEETFDFRHPQAVVFHGTADPWAETSAITEKCREQGIPLYLTEGANHSLETGNIIADAEELVRILRVSDAFIRGEGLQP